MSVALSFICTTTGAGDECGGSEELVQPRRAWPGQRPDLRGGQPSSTGRTVGQHLLVPFTAAQTGWRRVLHGPVCGAEQLLDALRNLRNAPGLIAHRAGNLSESQQKSKHEDLEKVTGHTRKWGLTGWDVRPCSASPNRESPAERSATCACWRLKEHHHWNPQGQRGRRVRACVCVSVCVCVAENLWVVPNESDLLLVHPRLQLQTGILSKRWNNETEDEGNADKDGRKDDLHAHAHTGPK